MTGPFALLSCQYSRAQSNTQTQTQTQTQTMNGLRVGSPGASPLKCRLPAWMHCDFFQPEYHIISVHPGGCSCGDGSRPNL